MAWPRFCDGMIRRKSVVASTLYASPFRRCLGLLDLICLGLASSLGLGMYVIMAYATRNDGGPAVVISVIIAGVSALLSALCYAEMAARLPQAGSAYMFTYVTLGEMCGFVIGWNMILENVIGGALIAKAWGQYFDFMTNHTVQRIMYESVSWSSGPVFNDFPDVLALLALSIVMIMTSLGVKAMTSVNIVLMVINILVVLCFICLGFFHVRHENWTNPPGFFPHGSRGVLAAASILKYAFGSFEIISSTTEESRDPTKSIPTGLVLSAIISFASLFVVSLALTLSFPWNSLELQASLSEMFMELQVVGSSTIISFGALLGLLSTGIGVVYFQQRLLYSFGKDVILPKWFGNVNKKTMTPWNGTVPMLTFTAVIAVFIKFDILLEIAAIGTLFCCVLVAMCVLCLRYQPEFVGLQMEFEDIACEEQKFSKFAVVENKDNCKIDEYNFCQKTKNNSLVIFQERTPLANGYVNQSLDPSDIPNEMTTAYGGISTNTIQHKATSNNGVTYKRFDSVLSSNSAGSVLSGLIRLPSDVNLDPNEATWKIVGGSLLVFLLSSMILSVLTVLGGELFQTQSWWIIILIFSVIILLISTTCIIARQPQNAAQPHFKTPYVPFIPLCSIIMDICFIAGLPFQCWIRFAVWMIIGLVVYFCYSYRHSKEHEYDEQEVVLYEITARENADGTTGQDK
ncbi:hypothetical protein ACJMK2_007128 [Sinanodonta woodiana]|uniref:Cationic amino acid transporter C-terminal domain-containing protein n=1 Tax=Sinanodonta woodiana TaxID=1069815 RepID=A0ABD3VKG9_SINWO